MRNEMNQGRNIRSLVLWYRDKRFFCYPELGFEGLSGTSLPKVPLMAPGGGISTRKYKHLSHKRIK